MAAIPTYDSLTVSPGTVSSGRVTLQKAPDVAGTDAINAGKSLDSVGAALNQVAVRNEYLGYLNRKADEKALIDNTVNDANAFVLDWKTRNAERTGQNAIGMTEEFAEQSFEWMSQAIKDVPPELQDQWRAEVEKAFIAETARVASNESEQKQLFRNDAFVARMESTTNRMITSDFVRAGKGDRGQDLYADDKFFEADLTDLVNELRAFNKEKGVSEDVSDNQIDKMLSSVYAERVQRLATQHPEAAKAYFEQHKDRITNPEQRRLIADTVDDIEDKAAVDQWLTVKWNEWAKMDFKVNAPMWRRIVRDQYKDPEQREYALAQFEKVVSGYDAERQRMVDDHTDRAWQVLNETNDYTQIDPNVANWLKANDPTGWAKIKSDSLTLMKPTPIATNWRAYSDLVDMIGNSPEAFKQVKLYEFRAQLSNEDFRYLVKKQAEMNGATDDLTRFQTPLAQVNDFLDLMEIEDKEEVGLFRREFFKLYDQRQIDTGRDPTRAEIQEDLDYLATEVTKKGMVFNTTRSRYKVTTEDPENAGEYQEPGYAFDFYDVPYTDVKLIRESFMRQFNRQPTQTEIQDVYNRANGLERNQ